MSDTTRPRDGADQADGAASDLWVLDEVIASDSLAGKRLLDRLVAQLEAFEWAAQEVFGIHLAMEEAVVNAIKHGNRHAVDKSVFVNCEISAERLFIRIRDEGPGFNPEAVPDCTDVDRLEVPSGRGIMLMRAFMNRVEYSASGNAVEMEKLRGVKPECAD